MGIPWTGSQKLGMAKKSKFAKYEKRFDLASELFERNLFEICESNNESTNLLNDLNNTKNTQICLF